MSANAPNTVDQTVQSTPSQVVPIRSQTDEPHDGLQTAGDLVVKNALVLISAGSIVALAVWLLA